MKKIQSILVIALGVCAMLTSCQELDTPINNIPTIETGEATEITATSALLSFKSENGNADKLNWNYISRYQVITPEFADKHNISINNNSQRTAAEWKKMIEETNLYECHEDYFYAYKNIRNDGYSHFNFQYQYLPGETYDCFSDYSDDENSFGLSAWTETRAHNYNDNGIVVKLKVNYADVTAIVYDSNKIRCKRITVLN